EALPCGDQAWLRQNTGIRGGMAGHRIARTPNIAEIPRLIEWIRDCCCDGAVTDDTLFRVTLAVEESVANVIQHAFTGVPAPHGIEVRLDISDARVTAVVIDNGRPFDPSTAPEPDLTLPLDRRDPG